MADGTKSALARTYIAENHKGGRPTAPAFPLVRASCALTDRMKILILNQSLHLIKVTLAGQMDFEPMRPSFCYGGPQRLILRPLFTVHDVASKRRMGPGHPLFKNLADRIGIKTDLVLRMLILSQ